MEHLHNRFDYDHEVGCLRWKALDENYVVVKPNGKVETNISPKSRVKAGSIAGRMGLGDYKVKQYGEKMCGLRMIWQHVTGEVIMGRIRTMHPRDTRFCIDNLYVVPFDQPRVHKDRARNSTVVSYCNEQSKFTVVQVDDNYNKTILSYHDDIETAFNALKEPIVSFL